RDGIALRGGLRDQRGQARDFAAGERLRAVDARAQVEVAFELQRSGERRVQRPARPAAVAHARERGQAWRGYPVGGAFVRERLAPAAGARGLAWPLAVADGAGAGGDVDAVGAGERPRPSADHVVVAGVTVVAEDGARDRVEPRCEAAVLAVRGQAEEGVAQVR